MSAVAPPACTKRGEGRDGSASGAGAGAGAGSGRGRGGGGGGEEAVISCRAAAAAALRGDSLRIGGLRVHVQHRCPPQAPKKLKCNCGYGFLLLKPSYLVRARTGKLAKKSDYIRTTFGLHSDCIRTAFRLHSDYHRRAPRAVADPEGSSSGSRSRGSRRRAPQAQQRRMSTRSTSWPAGANGVVVVGVGGRGWRL